MLFVNSSQHVLLHCGWNDDPLATEQQTFRLMDVLPNRPERFHNQRHSGSMGRPALCDGRAELLKRWIERCFTLQFLHSASADGKVSGQFMDAKVDVVFQHLIVLWQAQWCSGVFSRYERPRGMCYRMPILQQARAQLS